jgi:uncharacterized SAM-binding protein YcdF (DUF218 family)
MLYTLAKAFILPPGSLIILFLLGFLLVRGVLGRLFLFVGLTLLSLLSLPAVATKLMAGLEPYPPLNPASFSGYEADAILILGGDRYSWAPEYGGDTVGSKTLGRLRYGAFLHDKTGLPVYVTGGSLPDEDPPLGRLMAEVLASEFGIAVQGVEDQSQTTWENAERSASMLIHDGVHAVLLVTDAWHMPRAMGAFERVGVVAVAAPTAFIHREGPEEGDYRDWLPSAAAFAVSYFALHEWIGSVWYEIKGGMRSAASSV